ncbi:two-component system, LytT family, sensor histidine kinase LytS [Butyrivibrio sp. ob235]|uniref:LytS/YhcK type 5TM receptor domain-containing protein n=1 Tax=Butyrivibrio sp. ob235 TaxID=1761780 RepID=UPI0008AA8056|nr:LytS/YhcK type 5TM receptor domain-containing protein [Butyrivibrio sp. ob235]SEL70178.1 two-component system, LytT family, sensor histidine kinase LytS [Butyrivibrio sp. ob235]
MELYYNMIVNIGFLILIANILVRIPVVTQIICEEKKHTLLAKLVLGAIFGGFCIFSTCTGAQVQGAIPNTRVLGALAGGLLCGPTVGILAGLIGSVHRILFDIHGVTTFACALSTFMEGVLGALIYTFFQKRNIDFEWYFLVMITAACECLHMVNLLIFVKPFSLAESIVKVIAIPMVAFNSAGMVWFFSVFEDVYTKQNLIAADKMRLALNIADACVLNIRKSRITDDDYKEMEKTISGFSRCRDVFFLPYSQKNRLFESEYEFSEDFVEGMEKECTTQLIYRKEKRPFGFRQALVASGCRVTMGNETWGYLVLVFERRYSSPEAAECLVSALAKFFSTNYEAYQVEYQKKMRERAEFRVLQSQINPHFLFNSLNTISCFCREKPDYARELLLALSVYFRHNLNSSNDYMIDIAAEFEQVDAYLMLEKARFEDRLRIEKNIEEDIHMQVPTLILQPIVENAIKHGAMKREIGEVRIDAGMDGEELLIKISDNGHGIPDQVLRAFNDKTTKGKYGLLNVDGRLRSIYGEKYGLVIDSSPEGTTVTIRIPPRTLI